MNLISILPRVRIQTPSARQDFASPATALFVEDWTFGLSVNNNDITHENFELANAHE
jgi:hypothetical protein